MKCPKCGREFSELLAVSRYAPYYDICIQCSEREAFEDWAKEGKKKEGKDD